MIDRRRALLSEITTAKNTFIVTLDSDTSTLSIPLQDIEGTPVFAVIYIWGFEKIEHPSGERFAAGATYVRTIDAPGSPTAAVTINANGGNTARSSSLTALVDEENNTLNIDALRGYIFSKYYKYIVCIGATND